jgi:hypothetical protein
MGSGKPWSRLQRHLHTGSAGYRNYHNQADVCHTDQILKKGGLKDENTIVFIYDDIAHNLENSNPGTIMMLIYFICCTSTIRLQRDQSTRKAKSKGRVGEHNGLDCMHLHNSVQLIIGNHLWQ